MNSTKNITKRIISRQKTMLRVISKSIKNDMKTSALVLGLMGLPMFSSEALNNNMAPITNDKNNFVSPDTATIISPAEAALNNKVNLNNNVNNFIKDIMAKSLTEIVSKAKFDSIMNKFEQSQEFLITLDKEITKIKETLSEKKIPTNKEKKKGLYPDKVIEKQLTTPMKEALQHSQGAQSSIQSLEIVNKILPSFKDLANLISNGVAALELKAEDLVNESVRDLLGTMMRKGISNFLKHYTENTGDFNYIKKSFLEELKTNFQEIDSNYESKLLQDSEFKTGLTSIRNKLAEDFKIDDIKVKLATELKKEYVELSIQKSETLFELTDHKVIGIDLGTMNVVFVSNDSAVINIIEDNFNQKKCPTIKIAETPEKIFLESTKKDNSRVKKLPSTADIPGLIKKYCEECRTKSNHTKLKSVEGYKYLTQFEYKEGMNCIVPIQDMTTEIDINNPSEYGLKQIFGIMLQAKRHFAKQYSDKKLRFVNNGRTVDLNLTFNDNVPEKNKEIIAAIYAQVYAEKFEVDLSEINVFYIKESNAVLANFLYENYTNELKAITNYDKVVMLDLGQNGLRMKGLNGTDKEIQLTKSKAYQNISGDLIDQAIWNVCKEKVAKTMGESGDIFLTYDEAQDLVETDLSIKSKCLNAIKQAKEKLSASGASTINVSIDDLYDGEDVAFDFSVTELNEALDKVGLIETFKNDIQNGVKEMFGTDDTKDIEFVIIGGSLRIPYLQNVLQALTFVPLNRTVNMDEAPAYGASYLSLLKEGYKNKLSKKVDLKDIKFHSDNKNLEDIKSELDKLVNSAENYHKCAELRNGIETNCYKVDHKVDEDLPNEKKHIEEKLKTAEEKDKISLENRLLELDETIKLWKEIQLKSKALLKEIKGNANWINNLDSLNDIEKDFNKTTIDDELNTKELLSKLKRINNKYAQHEQKL